MSIDDVARELYGLAPEEFTSARNAAAKEARAGGDPQLAARVQALRKPTTGAWLLNQLVRAHPDEVQQVLELGAQLRAAQGALEAAELRALDQQRRALTRAVAQQARSLGVDAGRSVAPQVTSSVEETLRSAMVDEAAGAALTSGLLTDTFSANGLEPVDLDRVVAIPPPTTDAGRPRTTPPAPPAVEAPDPAHERRLAAAEEAATAAGSALEAAREATQEARARARTARSERESLEAERDRARRRLRDLEKQLAAAEARQDAASRQRDAAADRETTAAEAAERLRRQLERLRTGR